MYVIREARVDEYAEISIVLANAFLSLWNHNWFQNISEPITSIPRDGADRVSHHDARQRRRVSFYRALIQLVVEAGGQVNVVQVESEIASILLWLPPYARPNVLAILKSGFVRLAVWEYGLRSAWRVQVTFEGNVQRLIKGRVDLKEEEYGFVQMLATDVSHAGKQYGSILLKWQIELHKHQCPTSPGVLLDCTSERAVALYREKFGFSLLGEIRVETGTDSQGINLDHRDREFGRKKAEAQRACVQRVMVLRFS